MMNIDAISQLKPGDVTPAIKQAVAAVLLARTFAEVKRAQVDAVKREELATAAYMVAKGNRSADKSERITDPKDDWLMSDVDFADYIAQCERVELARGIRPADMQSGYCPALVAESLLQDAHRVLVEATKPLAGVEWDKLIRYLPGHKKMALAEWVDLWCGLVVNLPDFKNPLTEKAA